MEFEKALRSNTTADIYFDAIHKRAYSVDASIYEVEPIGIALPKSKQDLIALVKICHAFKVPMIARGAATGITGGCIGQGLIIDTSKYLNRILNIDWEEKTVTCEPGIVLDRLNEALAPQGYWLGPETSTGNRATVGGMLANNAAGARSLRYGKMVDHILKAEVILSSGESLSFQVIDEIEWKQKRSLNDAEGNIYREIYRIKEVYGEEILKHFPRIPRRVSGYNLDELMKPQPLNIAKLIAGSEGSLGVIAEMKLRLSKRPEKLGLCVIHFQDMIQAMRSIEEMLEYHPVALEMVDHKIMEAGRDSPALRGKLDWLQGNPEVIFVAEFDGDLDQKLPAFVSTMQKKKIGYAYTTLTNPLEMSAVWELRKSGLGLLLSKRSYSRAIAFIEDLSLPPEHLASFFEKFLRYLKSVHKEAGIYGHVGSGCMHIRPYIDLRKESELHLMVKIMEEISSLVLDHGGAMSGEHGDGMVRSWLNEKMFGKKIYQAFVDVKAAFDPENLMNPGKVVNGQPVLDNLRKSQTSYTETFMDFSPEGGFELSADLCNGNGQCRKKEGVMCPSFQVTGMEYDTTRARAQALRHRGDDEALHSILDLCISCKGCKTECPSQVDMAKMKAEFLYQYQEKRGYSLRTRLFGHIGTLYRIPFLSIFSQFKWIKRLLGIAPDRPLPQRSRTPFSKWLKHHPQPACSKKVVLFNDTFTEYTDPHIGQDAIKVLNAMGYEVIVPPWHCCGRPFISKGMLRQAKLKAQKLIEVLHPYVNEGLPIIGLEPSCILTFRDEFLALVGNDQRASEIAKACVTFDEFINGHLVEGKLPLQFQETKAAIMLHGHCHQKAIVGTKPTLSVLKSIPGFTVTEIQSGCCGMAGSFGYEAEHAAFSMKIGELRLFPAIRKTSADAIIVADGVSCRHQISQGTGRQALHLAEILARSLPFPSSKTSFD